ncbi:CoA-binding protein [Elusimicrobiota bacterium]
MKNKKIVVIGVSDREHKYGFKIFRDLLQAGYNVEGVNPRGIEVLGKKLHKNLQELKYIPDMAITVVNPEITEKVVEDCKKLGIKEIWMQPGSESQAAIDKAKNYGLSVTHNACIMIQRGLW